MKKCILVVFYCFFVLMFSELVFAQGNLRFEQNKGQWNDRVLYMA